MKKLLRVCFLWVVSFPLIVKVALAQTGPAAELPSWFSRLYQGIVPSFQSITLTILSFLPTIVGVLVIVTIGALIAKGVQIGVQAVLGLEAVEKVIAKILKKPLTTGGITATFAELVGNLLYYVLIAITVVLAVNYSGLLPNSTGLIASLLGYISNVAGAIFVSILGVLLANFFGALVRLITANLNIDQSEGLSKLTRLVIVIFTGIVALRELGVVFALTGRNLDILFAAVSLALALSFGLGGKDIAAKYLAGVVKKYTKET
jgi:hypothetical protein